jgi:hypothetical protein
MPGLPLPRVLVIPFVVLVLALVLLPAAGLQSAGIQGLPALVPGGRAPTSSFTGTVTAPGSAQFQGTGAMSAAHSQHTATLLTSGKVLVVGGSTASADLYDPATGLWAATGSMSISRTRHTATLLGNGKVLVAGGWDSASGSSAELYDPSTGLWTATGSMDAPRGYHTATLLGSGKVLVAGGVNGSVDQASAELYDPLTGLWTPAVSMHAVRSGHTATMLGNGTVLVAGGGNGWGSYIANAELYDPSTGLWATTGSMNVARIHYTATLLGSGKVLAAGGWDSASGATAELYDPATRLWTATGGLSPGRGGHTATLLGNGKVLVAGCSSVHSVELYDPTTGGWATIGNNIGDSRCFTTATLLANDKLLLAGGEDYSPPEATAELGTYSPGVMISATLTLPTDWSTNPIPVQIVGSTAGDGLDAFALSNDGSTWGPWLPATANTPINTTWDVGTTGGNRTVHLRARDLNGQYSEVVAGTMYDTGAPSGAVTINGGAPTATSTMVTLTLSATDALSTVGDMSFSNDGSTWSAWQPYATSAPWTLSSGDGLKTVYARFRDLAGNVSPSATAEIVLSAGGEYGVSVNSGAQFTNSTNVALTLIAPAGTTEMIISNDQNFAGSVWESYAISKAWTISPSGSYGIPRTVYARFRTSGVASSLYRASITLDLIPPTGSIAIVGITPARSAALAEPTPTTRVYLPMLFARPGYVQLVLSATDDLSGVGQMKIGNDADFTDSIWEPCATAKTWPLPIAIGPTYTVYARFRDNAGNESQTYFAGGTR